MVLLALPYLGEGQTIFCCAWCYDLARVSGSMCKGIAAVLWLQQKCFCCDYDRFKFLLNLSGGDFFFLISKSITILQTNIHKICWQFRIFSSETNTNRWWYFVPLEPQVSNRWVQFAERARNAPRPQNWAIKSACQPASMPLRSKPRIDLQHREWQYDRPSSSLVASAALVPFRILRASKRGANGFTWGCSIFFCFAHFALLLLRGHVLWNAAKPDILVVYSDGCQLQKNTHKKRKRRRLRENQFYDHRIACSDSRWILFYLQN